MENLKNGEHREYYEDRSLKAVYTLKDGKKEGPYVEYFQNSDRIKVEANYKDGELDGEYRSQNERRLYEHGILREKEHRNCLEIYDEKGELIEKHSSVEDMEYKDGQPWNGEVHVDHNFGDHGEDHHKKKFTVKNGKICGKYIDDYEAFKKYSIEANYDNGVLHGTYKEEREAFKKEGSYNQGVFSGTVQDYDKTERYENGILINSTQIKDGMLVEKQQISEGVYQVVEKAEGPRLWYGAEPQYHQTSRYTEKNGQKDGLYQEFDPKGWMRVEATYKNGALDGFYKELNSDGTVASMRKYENGTDVTAKYERLKELAQKRIGKDEKGTTLPKRTKAEKLMIGLQLALSDKAENKR